MRIVNASATRSEIASCAAKIFVNCSLRNAQFLTQGFGARKPKAPNQKPYGADDPEGRQQNRRVEIIFKK
jgi:flagellar motor protein MotB